MSRARRMSVILFGTMIAIGAFGLVGIATTFRPGSDARLIAAQREKMTAMETLLAAKDGLIVALEHKANAFEREAKAAMSVAEARGRLADERERTLAVYRKMVPAVGAAP